VPKKTSLPLEATDRSPHNEGAYLLSDYSTNRIVQRAQHHVGGALTMLFIFTSTLKAEVTKVLPVVRLM